MQVIIPTVSAFLGARGMAALKNWKRPSMDDHLVPTEPFIQVRPWDVSYVAHKRELKMLESFRKWSFSPGKLSVFFNDLGIELGSRESYD